MKNVCRVVGIVAFNALVFFSPKLLAHGGGGHVGGGHVGGGHVGGGHVGGGFHLGGHVGGGHVGGGFHLGGHLGGGHLGGGHLGGGHHWGGGHLGGGHHWGTHGGHWGGHGGHLWLGWGLSPLWWGWAYPTAGVFVGGALVRGTYRDYNMANYYAHRIGRLANEHIYSKYPAAASLALAANRLAPIVKSFSAAQDLEAVALFNTISDSYRDLRKQSGYKLHRITRRYIQLAKALGYEPTVGVK